MQRFTSSAIKAAHYQRAGRRLYVWFQPDGVLYEYRGVSARVYAGLIAADSKGTYVNAHIREDYPFTKLGARPLKPPDRPGAAP